MAVIDEGDDDDSGRSSDNDTLINDTDEWETSTEITQISDISNSSILSTGRPPSLPAVSVETAPDQAEIEISSGPTERTPDQSRPRSQPRPEQTSVLDIYFIERAKFINHLEKRAQKFTKKSKEDYDRARWGRPKQQNKNKNLNKNQTKNQSPPPRQAAKPKAKPKPPALKPPPTPAPARNPPPTTATSRANKDQDRLDKDKVKDRNADNDKHKSNKHNHRHKDSDRDEDKVRHKDKRRTDKDTSRTDESKDKDREKEKGKDKDRSRNQSEMIASTSKNVARAAASAVKPSRAFSTTAPALKPKAKADATAMEVSEAVRVCRALEISSPHATYTLTVDIKPPKSTKFPSIRGRVSLPRDPRRITDRILVFAETNSLSARLARETGVTWVGADDLFEPLLNGELDPTKILATPGMMPLITARLARFLGPKGLMPTVRRGGVGEGEELVKRIQEAKGAIDWMSDTTGKIRTPIARMNFNVAEVERNIRALASSMKDALTGNAPSKVDSHLLTRRQAKTKSLAGVYGVHLATTNGVQVALKDAFQ